MGNYGCFAQGTTVESRGDYSCFAPGYKATALGTYGSFAVGKSVTAIGNASFAHGYNSTATAANCMILFAGNNQQANSLKVGGSRPIRLCAAGQPSSPANGDIWVDATGNVIIRSNGSNVTIA